MILPASQGYNFANLALSASDILLINSKLPSCAETSKRQLSPFYICFNLNDIIQYDSHSISVLGIMFNAGVA